MASGTEMMIVSMLKAFMPKEAAEKIGRMVEDGTFDRIGALPSDIDKIKDGLVRILLRLEKLDTSLAILAAHIAASEGNFRNPLLDAAERGLIPAASPEYGANGNGEFAGSSRELDGGHG